MTELGQYKKGGLFDLYIICIITLSLCLNYVHSFIFFIHDKEKDKKILMFRKLQEAEILKLESCIFQSYMLFIFGTRGLILEYERFCSLFH